MLFNSNIFIQFFAAFLLLYFLVRRSLAGRNRLIVGASFLFYGWWDFRFLSLLLLSTLVDFYVALRMDRARTDEGRKRWLWVSVTTSLTVLGFFKYYGFFAESAASAARALGVTLSLPVWHVVLPVGISFYTFQTMSYVIDVYRRQLPPTRDLTEFMAYVSFFPQLVAGPIERASHLLPQFGEVRTVTREGLRRGLWLVIWGLFKKVVVADSLAPMVDLAFRHPNPSGPVVVGGTVAFAFQVYGDFSGYSDIARGIAGLLGFELMSNFNLPYLSTDLREFWRRWHISLSTWLRDYLYIPLGGNRGGEARACRNLAVTFVLGGLWHGAAWNFVLWGAWHAVGLVIHRQWANRGFRLSGSSSALGWILTMAFVLYGWLLFRAQSLDQIWSMTRALGSWRGPAWTGSFALLLGSSILPLVLLEMWQWRAGDSMAAVRSRNWVLGLLEGGLLLAIVYCWGQDSSPFIYFQF